MIRRFQLCALIFSFLIGVNQASALDLGAQVGARINQSSVPSGVTAKDQMGFQGGLLAVVPIIPLIGFRTGGLLVQRDAKAEVTGFGEVTTNRLFFDVPLTLQANLGIAKLYAGADVGVKVSSSCKFQSLDCTDSMKDDEKAVVFQPVVGADISIMPFISLGVFYEPETEYNKEWKQSAYGITGTIMF